MKRSSGFGAHLKMTFVCFSSNRSRIKLKPVVARERNPTKAVDGFDEVDNGLICDLVPV